MKNNTIERRCLSGRKPAEETKSREVVFTADKGVTYLAAIDGVDGVTGVVQLNHELAKAPTSNSVTENT